MTKGCLTLSYIGEPDITCSGVHAGTMVTAQTNPDDDEEPMFMQYFRGGKGGNVRADAAKGATAAPAAAPQFRTVSELLVSHINGRGTSFERFPNLEHPFVCLHRM